MDSVQIREIIGWVIGVIALNIIAIITGVYSIVKTRKMLPLEIRGVDLNNLGKEVSIADQLEALATKAADKALKADERLSKIEESYRTLREENGMLKERIVCLEDKAEVQEALILDQSVVINEQSIRIDLQDTKIKDQEKEIGILRCELDNSKHYNATLIQQMKDQNLIPFQPSPSPIQPCTEEVVSIKPKGKTNGK